MRKELSRTLLAWYARHRRDLPWRETRDPYKIWTSEIMLQQTQVQTVLNYYSHWVRRFPTIRALAEAPQEQVLKAWQGLGYYQRAKNLQRAAQEIMTRYAGVFPRGVEEMRKLPGIGAYTAGAIASIAFDEPVCALDVNVLRVAARLLLIRRDPANASVRRAIGEKIMEWMPRLRARWFNQALMELGALICLPVAPRCPVCPVQKFCRAHECGAQEKISPERAAAGRVKISVVAGILRDDRGRVLIQKRPAHGLMGDLWEFPGGKVHTNESLQDALAREWQEELGIKVRAQRKLMTIRHAYTKFDVRLHVFSCRWLRGRPAALWAQQIRWVGAVELDNFAYSSANVKIVRWLQEGKMSENLLEEATNSR